MFQFLLLLPALCHAVRDPVKVHDVIIVGGGIAGVGAAVTFIGANTSDFLILEASNRTGGRIKSRAFGHQSVYVGRIEEGANWFHGTIGDDSQTGLTSLNPIWKMASRAALASVAVPGASSNVSGYAVFREDGERLPDNVTLRAVKAYDCLNQTSINAKVDQSLADGLATCGWTSDSPTDFAMEWELTSADQEDRSDQTSLLWTLPDATYSNLGPDDHLCHDQRPRGYATIVDELGLEGGLELQDHRILLGKTVKGIHIIAHCDHGERCVQVTTSEGEHFFARRVVSTLPLGVMQARHTDMFDPALSPRQARALATMTMGNFTKIFIQFPEVFWRERGQQWLVGSGGYDDPKGFPIEFHDLDSLVPGFKTLFSYVTGDTSIYWEALSDEDAKQALLARLGRIFPNVSIPEPTDFFMTRHGLDPLTIGAYSTPRLGFTAATAENVRVPLEDMVFFGGEHTCRAFPGYTHGAYWSGIGAARQALSSLGRSSTMIDYCEHYLSARRK